MKMLLGLIAQLTRHEFLKKTNIFNIHLLSDSLSKRKWEKDLGGKLSMVLYMCLDRFLLAFESRDISQADKSVIRVSSFPN